MNNFSQNRSLIIIFAVGVFFLFVILFLLFLRTTTPHLGREDFKTNYSKLNTIVPGKSTIQDVEKIAGTASSRSFVDGKTYLYYKTPNPGFTNIVVIKNGVVLFSLENVFSDYGGEYNKFVGLYGKPDLTLYSSNEGDFDWSVFLKHGVAFQSSSNKITAVLYFPIQTEASFITNIASELKLSKNHPKIKPEVFAE